MTRLFGIICNQPQAFGSIIEPARAALQVKGPVGRWGVGYVQWGEVCLKLSPRASEAGVDFYEALRGLPTDYILGAVAAADGLKGNANTPPFRYRRWLYAQEDSGVDFALIAPKLAGHIPDYLKRNIQGTTAAEQVFHLFLSVLHDTGKVDDANLEIGIFRGAIQNTLAILDSQAGDAAAGLGNIVITNSRSMIAVRRAGPLYVCRLKQSVDPKRPESEFRAVLVVSASENPGPGFEEVPAGKMVSIQRDVTTQILDIKGP